MKIKRLIQFSAGFNPGDAISNQMLTFKSYCEKNGMDSEIYAENISPFAKKHAKRYKSYTPKKGDCILYHHSIHSAVLEYLLDKCLHLPKMLMYHNVTPYHFFEPYDLKFSFYLRKGREELLSIKDDFILNLAVSNYNAQELKNLNFKNIMIFPITLDFAKFQRLTRTNFEKNILFVGRIAPNKAQEDLIKFIKIYSDNFDKNIKLKLVGNTSLELTNYKRELETLVKYLHLENQVVFLNFLDQVSLCKHYSEADIFLCLSEHEGFCVPLIESMFYDIPIIAYDAGAVRETLNGGGILFKKKEFLQLAYFSHRLMENGDFRETILQTQRKVLEQYRGVDYEKKFLDLILTIV